MGPPGGPPGDFLAELMQKQRNKTLKRGGAGREEKNDHASDNDSRDSREVRSFSIGRERRQACIDV